jgi:peptide/nickel transport system substrate-binding protein
MIDRVAKLRLRRLMRSQKRQVEDLGVQAEEQLEQHFFRRLGRLSNVRRFVAGWLSLFVLLIIAVALQTAGLARYYQAIVPVSGGVYTEGMLGNFTNANPMYAVGPVDMAVSRLLFDGLLMYNEQNQLVGGLAEKWAVDEAGTNYTVTLRPNLVWHDGKPITSDDVVFTYKTIQNPDAKSPLITSWQSVRVVSVDARTVRFTLPAVLASFPYSLTNGIVPKHLLADTPVSQLRSISFDTIEPVGSGPFKMEAIEVTGDTPETRQEQIALAPNERYHGGAPKLQQYKIRSFLNEKTMTESFENQELNGMSGLEALPDVLAKANNVHEYNIPMTGQIGVFFKTKESALQDKKIRQALTHAVDRGELLRGLGYPVIAAHSPLLTSHFASTKDAQQLPYNVETANKLLDEAGWKKDAAGNRTKDGQKLTVRLYSRSTSEYSYVTQTLQRQWKAVGVQTDVTLQSDDDLQDTIGKRDYDALLYGISLGPDPDVFAYWHSSQADIRSVSRLNFSDYTSSDADKALEAGRTRTDTTLRSVKYRPFLDTWRTDAPGIMLYQPRYLYVTRGTLYGFNPKVVNTAIDRYANVQNWMIRETKASK